LPKVTQLWSSSLVQSSYVASPNNRDVKKVPFVELFNNRLQGVVSSASDIERVYVAYFEVRTLNYCCSTNNNRPCGGLRGHPCNHLQELLHEAIAQFGMPYIQNFLQLTANVQTERDILSRSGQVQSSYAADIFSRFLSDLELLEVPTLNTPLSPRTWFTL
jgi:hypothetical protein